MCFFSHELHEFLQILQNPFNQWLNNYKTGLNLYKFIFFIFFLFSAFGLKAQHHSELDVRLKSDEAILVVYQNLTFENTSEIPLKKIILNDWNNAFSSKNSALAKRFSDEFVRSFYYAKDEDLGKTTIFSLTDNQNNNIEFQILENHIDLIEIHLKKPLNPNEKITLKINYEIKLPNEKFTRYGFDSNGKIEVKDWILFPAMLKNNDFLKYSNENLNDAPNAVTDFIINFESDKYVEITSNLQTTKQSDNKFILVGQNINSVYLTIEPKTTFKSFKNSMIEVETNLFDSNIDEFGTALIIDKIVTFTHNKLGQTNQKKIVVSETDYKKNPFYGLNQLPSFLRPFPDTFMYELKFLKTYTENYVTSGLNIDSRKDNWIANAIEIYLIMEYLEEFYPEMKMLGNVSNLKILNGYYGTKMNFKDQFYYLYLMMARRNLDQSTGSPKNELIKFNEQIAGKYKAGLDLKYLEDFLEQGILDQSVREFFALNQNRETSQQDLKTILESNTYKNIDWYFDEVVHSRNLIDYKISKVQKDRDSVQFKIKNKGQAVVPVSVFGIKNNEIVFKNWYENIKKDSIFSVKNEKFDRLIVNYDQKIPEYNMRNNSKSLKGFFSQNRPLKLTLFKDFENPTKNQLFYIPEFRYNLYNGFSPGIKISTKSMLRKPFVLDVTPFYSFLQKTIVGAGYIGYENLIREGNLYSVNYGLQASYYHYAPDATYTRIIPSVLFRIREPNFRDNKKQSIYIRHVNVHREKSDFSVNLKDENYSVFNVRYNNFQQEITKHFSFQTDIQLSNLFGKLSSEIEFRRLYNNNRQLNLRFYAGMFTYRNTTSDFFSFATDRPTDYMFDYNFYGRSEDSGFFSQQYITTEGGFKSKLTPYANQWIAATNVSFNVWNWIEVYSDFGFIKNRYSSPEFLYDSGIRLNLVTDYFEVYFPVYSNLGWEVGQPHYNERIRFVITIAPNTLINLVSRKWL